MPKEQKSERLFQPRTPASHKHAKPDGKDVGYRLDVAIAHWILGPRHTAIVNDCQKTAAPIISGR
jgi:hypothetical protein